MVESLIHALQRNLFPAARVVAGLAILRETATMRILVAIGTLIERNAHILWLAVGAVDVALGALYLRVQPSQRITGLGVIELPNVDGLPVHKVVTALTIRSEPSLVLILVARDATLR